MPVASASSATVPALLSQVPCQLPWAFWVRAVHGGVPPGQVLDAKHRLVDPAGSTLPSNRPASDTRQRDATRPVVVLHHLRLARSDGRVHDLVQVGEFHLHPVDDRHDSILTDKTALEVCPGGGQGCSPGEPAEPGWLPGLVADDFRVLVTSGGMGERRHSAATGSDQSADRFTEFDLGCRYRSRQPSVGRAVRCRQRTDEVRDLGQTAR